jgi:predicted acylesterase/phospholipase RssA
MQASPIRLASDAVVGFRLVLFALVVLTSACATPSRLPAVPSDLTTQAQPAVANARYWADSDLQLLTDDALAAYRREQAWRAQSGQAGPLPPQAFLALSGGGDNGAFGAGLLAGWTASGTRPEFRLVTGISTGALIAPFAFLGPDYDATLRSAYTEIRSSDIFEPRPFYSALFADAMADSAPMRGMIARYITPELLRAIAAEYDKGRILLVGTTDLDARRPVIWNMTAIASSADPGALDLFRQIILASASIPGAFPPVMIDVEVNGQAYQEMHVDGGASAQVFVYPPRLNVSEMRAAVGADADRQRTLYVINNGRMDPAWASVDRRTMSIAGRAVSSLIQTQGAGNVYQIYNTAQRDGLDFNLAFIASDFSTPHVEDFDQTYMRSLFQYAYDLAVQGYPWRKEPPNLSTAAR